MSTAQKLQRVAGKVANVNRSRVARELGLDRSYVSQVLGGKRVPGLDVAAGIAREVGVSLDDFHIMWLRVRANEKGIAA